MQKMVQAQSTAHETMSRQRNGLEYRPKASSSSAFSGFDEYDVVLKTTEEKDLDFFNNPSLTNPEITSKDESRRSSETKDNTRCQEGSPGW